MTNEDWKHIENKLSYIGSQIHLEIDDYSITLMVEPYKKLKNCIAVYVDGKIKCDWMFHDCEIRRRFYQKHIKCLIRIDRKKLEKASKPVRKMVEEYQKENTYEYFEPYWTTFNTMKRHFIKNNISIELCTENKMKYKKQEG